MRTGRPMMEQSMFQGKPKVGSVAKQLLLYLGREKRKLAYLSILVLASTLLGLLLPSLVGDVIDLLPEIGKSRTINELLTYLLILFGLHAVATVISYFKDLLRSKFSLKLVTRMRNEYFTKVCKLEISYLDSRRHGDLISRGTNDIDLIVNVVSETLITFMSSIIIFVGCLVIMCWHSWQLTLICVTASVITFLLSGIVSGVIREHFTKQQKLLGKINSHAEDSFSIIRDIKLCNTEKYTIKSYRQISEALKKESVYCMALSSILAPINNLIGNLTFVAIAVAGGILALEHVISVSTIVVFILYLRQFTEPLNNFSNMISDIQASFAGAERFFEIINAPEEREGSLEEELRGDVVLKDVHFSYVANKEVLKGIHLQIKEGQKVALVGDSGCGKTTLINLLLRYYEPDSGEILIGGRAIDELTAAHLRKNVVSIMQDAVLFSENVWYNILYGNESQDVDAEAKVAEIMENLLKMDNDTIDDQTKMSEGQAQLISIARALMIQPRVMIFDESMSAVDSVNQQNLNKRLKQLFSGSTVITITHRLLTICDSDKIFFMKQGVIIEEGTHEELMNIKGEYYKAFRKQFTEEKGGRGYDISRA